MDALSLYLDASVLVAIVVNDPFTPRANAALRGASAPLLVSDFGAAEVSSTIARLHRTTLLSRDSAEGALADFDRWRGSVVTPVAVTSGDIRDADGFIRSLRFNLRTPDAIHLAIVRRLGAELATFDRRMADCARALGVVVAPL